MKRPVLSLNQTNKIVSVHYQHNLDKDFKYYKKRLRQNEKNIVLIIVNNIVKLTREIY